MSGHSTGTAGLTPTKTCFGITPDSTSELRGDNQPNHKPGKDLNILPMSRGDEPRIFLYILLPPFCSFSN